MVFWQKCNDSGKSTKHKTRVKRDGTVENVCTDCGATNKKQSKRAAKHQRQQYGR